MQAAIVCCVAYSAAQFQCACYELFSNIDVLRPAVQCAVYPLWHDPVRPKGYVAVPVSIERGDTVIGVQRLPCLSRYVDGSCPVLIIFHTAAYALSVKTTVQKCAACIGMFFHKPGNLSLRIQPPYLLPHAVENFTAVRRKNRFSLYAFGQCQAIYFMQLHVKKYRLIFRFVIIGKAVTKPLAASGQQIQVYGNLRSGYTLLAGNRGQHSAVTV